MPAYTVEVTYHLPVYRQRSYSAETPAQACRLAIEDDGWEDAREDADSSGESHVTGIWEGMDPPVRARKSPSHRISPRRCSERAGISTSCSTPCVSF